MERGFIAWEPGELTRITDEGVWARRCEWFVLCENVATHLEPHPILGEVPACDRCVQIGRTS